MALSISFNTILDLYPSLLALTMLFTWSIFFEIINENDLLYYAQALWNLSFSFSGFNFLIVWFLKSGNNYHYACFICCFHYDRGWNNPLFILFWLIMSEKVFLLWWQNIKCCWCFYKDIVVVLSKFLSYHLEHTDVFPEWFLY